MNQKEYFADYERRIFEDPMERFLLEEKLFEVSDIKEQVHQAFANIQRQGAMTRDVHAGLYSIKNTILERVNNPIFFTNAWTFYGQSLEDSTVLKNLFGTSTFSRFYLYAVGQRKLTGETPGGFPSLDDVVTLFSNLPSDDGFHELSFDFIREKLENGKPI